MTDAPIPRPPKRASRAGLLAVLVMIGIVQLAMTVRSEWIEGGSGERIADQLAARRAVQVRSTLTTADCAVTKFLINHGRLPATLDVLTEPDPWNEGEPYVPESPLDPWGNALVLNPHGKAKFEIVSLGADGKPGGVGENEDRSSNQK